MKGIYPKVTNSVYHYGLTVLLLMVFLAGIYFIFWMGSSKTWVKVEDDVRVAIVSSPSPSVSNEINDIAEEESTEMCPTLLIKRGKQVMLFNKNLPEIPKENPIFFDNLEQYIAYVKVQREVYKQDCPVLFLQQETNAQGEDVYRMRRPNNNDITVDPLMLGSVADYFQNATKVSPNFMPPAGPKAYIQTPQNVALYGNTTSEVSGMTPPTVPYVDSNRTKPFNQGTYGFDPSSQYTGRYTILDQIHDSTKTQNPDGISDNAMDSNWGGAVFTADKIKTGKYSENAVAPPTVPSNLKFDAYPNAETRQPINTSPASD
jgi:hypothetical protein